MLAEREAAFPWDLEGIEATVGNVRCPMLLVHGTETRVSDQSEPRRLAELTGAPLVLVEGADHMIPGRHPVLANLLIRDFIRSLPEASNDGR
jgi:pimeloyl-ACP methyl ester carboxylesterase